MQRSGGSQFETIPGKQFANAYLEKKTLTKKKTGGVAHCLKV
jgi:hypothetical protein